MKSFFLTLAGALLLAGAPLFAQEQALGEKVPMSTAPMMGVDGKPHTLLSLKGDNGLLVVFLLQHLPFCGGQWHQNRRLGRSLQRPRRIG